MTPRFRSEQDHRVVQVVEVTEGLVEVMDRQTQQVFTVPYDAPGGLYPTSGDQWTVVKAYGGWSFRDLLTPISQYSQPQRSIEDVFAHLGKRGIINYVGGKPSDLLSPGDIDLSGYVPVGGSAADIVTYGTTISGGNVRTGVLESGNFVTGTGGYSSQGVRVGLDGNGYVTAPNFKINTSGDATFRGELEAATGSFEGDVAAESFSLVSGPYTLATLYSSDTSYERLRLQTGDTNSPLLGWWDIGWASTPAVTSLATSEFFIFPGVGDNPSQAVRDAAQGLFLFADGINQSSSLRAGSGGPQMILSTPGFAYLTSGDNAANLQLDFLGMNLRGLGDDPIFYATPGSLRMFGETDTTGAMVEFVNASSTRMGYVGYTNDDLWLRNEDGGGITYIASGEGTSSGDIRFRLAGNNVALYREVFNGGSLLLRGPDTEPSQTGTGYYDFHSALILRPISDAALRGELTNLTIQTTTGTDRHAVLQVWNNDGNRLRLVNAENTAHIPIRASAFEITSSEVFKSRIRTARDEGGLLDYAIAGDRRLAFRQFSRVRPILFDDIVQEKLRLWSCEDHDSRDECDEASCGGVIEDVNHHCDDLDWCGGTSERPCGLISGHVNRVSISVEELSEIYPRAVSRDALNNPTSYDASVLGLETLNVVQHLLEDRMEARSREARNLREIRGMKRQLVELELLVDSLVE